METDEKIKGITVNSSNFNIFAANNNKFIQDLVIPNISKYRNTYFCKNNCKIRL